MFKMRAKMILMGLLGTAALVPVDFAKADQLGHASWYSLPKNITANGERMNPNELTAAHRSLPFGTRVLVENLANGRFVVVRINDRGPFIGGRIIDLSKAAAASIGMIGAGTAKVRVSTAGGGVLAALGKSTAKNNDASKLAVLARVPQAPRVEPVKSVSAKMAQAAPKWPKAAPKMAKAAPKSSMGKSLAVAASAKKRDAAPIKVAAVAKRSTVSARAKARAEVLAAADGIRAAARQASSLGTAVMAASTWKQQDAERMIVTAAKPSKANARASARAARMLAAADGIRTPGKQASPHTYAVLGKTPGFMKSARTRTRRA